MSTVSQEVTAAELRQLGVISWLDYELSQALLGLSGERAPALGLAASLASWAVQRGHVCADLAQISERGFHDAEGKPLATIRLPELTNWLELLRGSALVQTEASQSSRPLWLDTEGRLYLTRYYEYEQRLARALSERARTLQDDVDASFARELERVFPGAQPELVGQRQACLVAALRSLSVISGGPGTGKTYTVAKLLLLLQRQALQRGQPLRMLLLAPTGKAAQRLSESLRASFEGQPVELLATLPSGASTLHSALGFRRNTPTRFRHDAHNPLPADVVIVDETSMVDLALMAKLVEAVRPDARLVLLGDKDQLASVEAGAILGDIYGGRGAAAHSATFADRVRELTGDELPVATSSGPALRDCIVHLTHVHRFAERGSIAQLARAVNEGDAEASLSLLDSGDPTLFFGELAEDTSLEAVFAPMVREWFCPLVTAEPAKKLQLLSQFRFLCAHRRGSFGVEAFNRFTQTQLFREGLIADPQERPSFEGRAILVGQNDYDVGLFNGDVGVIARQPEQRGLAAVFAGSEGLRYVSLAQIPAHETAFAMSVHKAQGSELDQVALILPPFVSPVLTRELLYTGITRARSKVSIFASREVLRRAIGTPVLRASGLQQALWGSPHHG